jgi:hypothetical protein
MLYGETVAVCCENRTEHTDTVRTSQETRYVSAAKPNRLMLCGETVAVCCENRMEHRYTVRTSQGTHRYIVWAERSGLLILQRMVHIVNTLTIIKPLLNIY